MTAPTHIARPRQTLLQSLGKLPKGRIVPRSAADPADPAADQPTHPGLILPPGYTIAPAPTAPAAPTQPTKALPRTHASLHTYVPPPAQSLRPGAEDHLRYRSRGF